MAWGAMWHIWSAKLRIRDREERAARREMARLTEQLIRHSRAARAQLERVRVEDQATLAAALERAATELREALERGRDELQIAQERSLQELRAEHESAAQLEAQRSELQDQVARVAAEARELRGERAEQEDLLRELREQLGEVEDVLQATAGRLEAEQRERARERAEHATRARRLEQSVSALAVGLRQTRDDIERAARSRAWRVGHLLTRTLSRIARRPRRTEGALVAALARIERVQSAVHGELSPGGSAPRSSSAVVLGPGAPPARIGSGLAPTAPGPAPAAARAELELRFTPAQERELTSRRAELAASLRARLGPPRERERWPTVSAIVPTRDGLAHLRRLFAGLIEHTDYPALEVVVVDNASGDGRLPTCGLCRPRFPVQVVANEENLSFAQANARGVERASGDLLLFLNNAASSPSSPAG